MAKNFMDRVLDGEIKDGHLIEDGATEPRTLVDMFHAAVDEWHGANTEADLMTWLGMTRAEYHRVVGRDGDLVGVIEDRISDAVMGR